jgi:hypothetical protein
MVKEYEENDWAKWYHQDEPFEKEESSKDSSFVVVSDGKRTSIGGSPQEGKTTPSKNSPREPDIMEAFKMVVESGQKTLKMIIDSQNMKGTSEEEKLDQESINEFIDYSFYFDNDYPEGRTVDNSVVTASQPYDYWYNQYLSVKGTNYITRPPEYVYTGSKKYENKSVVQKFFNDIIIGNYQIIQTDFINKLKEIIVEKNGMISNVKCLKRVSSGLDCEAMRVIKLMPRWTPAKNNGKPVRLYYNMPINFTLQ